MRDITLKQDMVKQNVLLKMYKISPNTLEFLEENKLERYQIGPKTVFYSISEFEETIRRVAMNQTK